LGTVSRKKDRQQQQQQWGRQAGRPKVAGLLKVPEKQQQVRLMVPHLLQELLVDQSSSSSSRCRQACLMSQRVTSCRLRLIVRRLLAMLCGMAFMRVQHPQQVASLQQQQQQQRQEATVGWCQQLATANSSSSSIWVSSSSTLLDMA
jgi:hypothetical protein